MSQERAAARASRPDLKVRVGGSTGSGGNIVPPPPLRNPGTAKAHAVAKRLLLRDEVPVEREPDVHVVDLVAAPAAVDAHPAEIDLGPERERPHDAEIVAGTGREPQSRVTGAHRQRARSRARMDGADTDTSAEHQAAARRIVVDRRTDHVE